MEILQWVETVGAFIQLMVLISIILMLASMTFDDTKFIRKWDDWITVISNVIIGIAIVVFLLLVVVCVFAFFIYGTEIL